MSSKAKGNRSTGAREAFSQVVETDKTSVGNTARDEKIRRRAYELYLERGQQPGRELEDWLEAEGEIGRGAP